MQNVGTSPPEPDTPWRLDPVAITMDIAAQIQAVGAAFGAAQAGAAQSALDRLATHSRQMVEAKHPLSVMAIQMEWCASLLDAAAAPFRAALRELPEPQAGVAARAPAVQPSVGHGAVMNAPDGHVPRRPCCAADAAGASEQPTRAERTE